MFTIPNNTRRIIIISNIENPPAFEFEQDDLIIELNKAAHHDRLKKVIEGSSIKCFLYVRHSKKGHFFPENFLERSIEWDHVVLGSPSYGFSKENWFSKYVKKNDGKVPTTGYAIYQYFRNRRPSIKIIGLGFNLDDHSTPHSPMHAWEYEFEQYKKDRNFTAVQ